MQAEPAGFHCESVKKRLKKNYVFKQKGEWKRKVMEIIIRHNNNENIPLEEKQQLMGKLAYYKMIEPDYFNYLNQHYQEKYNTNFETILKTQL